MLFEPLTPPVKQIRHVHIKLLKPDFDELEEICRLRSISKNDFVAQAIRYAIDNLECREIKPQ